MLKTPEENKLYLSSIDYCVHDIRFLNDLSVKNGHWIISIFFLHRPFTFVLENVCPISVNLMLNECLKKWNEIFINIKVFIDVYVY